MTDYQHTQRGTLILTTVGLACLMTLAITIGIGMKQPLAAILPGAVLLLLVVCLVLFGSLTVQIARGEISVAFGPGVIRKRIAVSEISHAEVVRNKWYYGWGIRLTPHGWLYNVSGLDAVEIHLRSGRKFRIGTDEPQQLHAAIDAAAQQAGG